MSILTINEKKEKKMGKSKDRMISVSKDNFVQTPDEVIYINPDMNKRLSVKLDEAEDLLKNIFNWLLSNDTIDEDTDMYAYRVQSEIPALKDQIDNFFKENA